MVISLAAEVTTAGSTVGVTRFFKSAVRHEIPVVLWFSRTHHKTTRARSGKLLSCNLLD
jgi:hypothetical protein